MNKFFTEDDIIKAQKFARILYGSMWVSGCSEEEYKLIIESVAYTFHSMEIMQNLEINDEWYKRKEIVKKPFITIMPQFFL